MPASRYTAEQRTEALRLYQAQGPTAAGKQLGIPKETIASWARKAGVHTVRSERTRKAVEAKVVDAKLRRANIAERLYGQAEKILDDLESPKFRTILKASFGEEKAKTLDFIPANDKKTLLQAVGTAMTTTAKLEAVDTDNGVQGAVSMLDKLIEQIGVTGGDSGVPEAAPVPAEE